MRISRGFACYGTILSRVLLKMMAFLCFADVCDSHHHMYFVVRLETRKDLRFISSHDLLVLLETRKDSNDKVLAYFLV